MIKKNGILPSEFLRLQVHILDTSKRPLVTSPHGNWRGRKAKCLGSHSDLLKKKEKKKFSPTNCSLVFLLLMWALLLYSRHFLTFYLLKLNPEVSGNDSA